MNRDIQGNVGHPLPLASMDNPRLGLFRNRNSNWVKLFEALGLGFRALRLQVQNVHLKPFRV